MTINNEFFKRTQENMKKIRAENNALTKKVYRIDEKEKKENKTNKTNSDVNSNVIRVDFSKGSQKQLTSSKEVSIDIEERYKRIGESIQRINSLMRELEEKNK